MLISNEDEDHLQSDRDEDIDDNQFIQMISKKAKKRKPYSENGKKKTKKKTNAIRIQAKN